MAEELFRTVQFFDNGMYEYLTDWVSAEEAVTTAKSFTETIGAKMGIVRRIIVIDGGDCTVLEWRYGEGLVYPERNGAAAENKKLEDIQ